MANCNSNCGRGCSRRTGGYGTLSMVGSCRSCGWNDPFYTGPCPPKPCGLCGCASGDTDSNGCARCRCRRTERCGCGRDAEERHCGHCGCNRGCDDRRACEYDEGCWGQPGSYALLAAEGPLSVAAGGAIPLTACGDEDADDEIVLCHPGIYRALYTFNAPLGTAVNTTLELRLSGRPLYASAVEIAAAGASCGFCGQTIFEARRGDALTLNTINALSIPDRLSAPVATLTLVKLA